jgi:Ca2+-binding RTX toxin-like protein
MAPQQRSTIAAVFFTAAAMLVRAGHAAPLTTATCTIKGTPQADFLVGTSGRDVICGLGGDDTIAGAGGDDLLIGGTGADRIEGDPGGDTMLGGPGNDTFFAFDGRSDRIDGGLGRDTAYIDGADAHVVRVESNTE